MQEVSCLPEVIFQASAEVGSAESSINGAGIDRSQQVLEPGSEEGKFNLKPYTLSPISLYRYGTYHVSWSRHRL
ncbi:MAG: hypothetical protein F6J95_015315 [Leptolyngbya sp. SIO1E4]|nr:hypothetical protein [Leptolyngbya sp. SIO1E4]